mmetsp:Transcript_19211/g.31525  ORF Transcript_19211/g.31525 Transcript_19211/m.31525 type:complete len:308 (+) Transcript_19211:105-1028(+)
MKGLFGGSGSDALNNLQICKRIVKLAGKSAPELNVLYLGAATYDLEGPKERQTSKFREMGCNVTSLDVALVTPDKQEIQEKLGASDVIVVSGGNTLYAVDRFNSTGVTSELKKAMDRDAVLTGGSAGAIVWFDGGHSDSGDPDSFKQAMVNAADTGKDESSGAPTSEVEKKKWDYIRVPGLGFLPGLMCPHYDKVQSNGVLRAFDFDEMMKKHSGERGICIDHWAALIVDGEDYEVLSVEGMEGSKLEDGSFSSERLGAPAVWVKNVVQGKLQTELVASHGKVHDLLRKATSIEPDPRVEDVRKINV